MVNCSFKRLITLADSRSSVREMSAMWSCTFFCKSSISRFASSSLNCRVWNESKLQVLVSYLIGCICIQLLGYSTWFSWCALSRSFLSWPFSWDASSLTFIIVSISFSESDNFLLRTSSSLSLPDMVSLKALWTGRHIVITHFSFITGLGGKIIITII